jgi:excisionase family DNA binding protein
MTEKKVLTLTEACDYLGLKKSYVYKLTSAGILPHSKPNGKTIYFDRGKLEDWMLSNPSSSLSDRRVLASTYISSGSTTSLTSRNQKFKK